MIATKTPKIRQLRTVKKEILKLMETYIKKAEDLDAVNVNFMPPLLDAILGDYSRNVPTARDAEVLNVMATITGRLGVSHSLLSERVVAEFFWRLQPLLTPQVPAILDAVFEPTLNMINQDFAEFPEHRVGFFKLLRAINLNCFPGRRGGIPFHPRSRSRLHYSSSWNTADPIQAVHGQYYLGDQTYHARYRGYGFELYVDTLIFVGPY